MLYSVWNMCYAPDMPALRTTRVRDLRSRREKLLQELGSLRVVIRGTCLERFSTCSRSNCVCHKGQKHGPRDYVVVTDAKRQRQHYVPRTQVQVVRRGVGQYHRLLEVLTGITRINLELMRGGELDDRRN